MCNGNCVHIRQIKCVLLSQCKGDCGELAQFRDAETLSKLPKNMWRRKIRGRKRLDHDGAQHRHRAHTTGTLPTRKKRGPSRPWCASMHSYPSCVHVCVHVCVLSRCSVMGHELFACLEGLRAPAGFPSCNSSTSACNSAI